MAGIISSWKLGGTGKGTYTLKGVSVSRVPLTVQGAAGQTANIFDVKNSAGSVLFSVDPSGNLSVAGSITATINEVVTGNVEISGTLTVAGVSTLNGNIVLGNAQTDTLNVYALSTFHAPAVFSSSLSVTGSVLLANGTAGVPSLAFADDLDTGIYRAAANQIGFAVAGAVELTLNATNLSPGANDGLALGVSGTAFADLFLASGAVINFAAGDVTITHAANLLTIAGGQTVFTDATTGYIGIQLQGQGTYAGSDWILFASSVTASSVDDFLGFYNNNTDDGAVQGYKLIVRKNGHVIYGYGEGLTPVAGTFRGADAVGTNIAAATSTIRNGLGTGTGGAGITVLQGAANGFTTGTTAHTAVTLLQIGNVHTAAVGTTGAFWSSPATTHIDRWTAGAGTAANTVAFSIGQPTFQGQNAITMTDAMNVYIAGGPVESTNVTMTNSHALYIAAGAVSAATNSYGLTVNAQTGAGTNFAAQFIGGDVSMDNQLFVGTSTTAVITGVVVQATTATSAAPSFIASSSTTYGPTITLNKSNGTAKNWFLHVPGTASGYTGATDQTFVIADGTDHFFHLTAAGVFRFGSADGTATPVGATLRGSNGVGTNVAGITTTVAAGTGTGTGNMGVLAIQSAIGRGTTGTTAHTLGTLLQVGNTGATASEVVGKFLSQAATTHTDRASAGGTIANIVFNSFATPTLAFGTATTVTDTATWYIAGAPVAGSGATLTNVYSLWVDAGNVRVDGMIIGNQGTDIASGNNATLTSTGNYFDVTGTTQINTLSVAAGVRAGTQITLQFDASVTVKHATAGTGAQFALSASGDFMATAGDTLTVIYDGTVWREVSRTAI